MFWNSKLKNQIEEQKEIIAQQQQAIGEVMSSYSFGTGEYFDGEKTPGDLGAPVVTFPDYYGARERGWELQLTNDVAKLIMNKWSVWLVGKGLRFNAVPPKDRIPNFNRDNFIANVEYRFRTHMNSRYSDYSSMVSFHQKAKEAYYNAKVGGDDLAVYRIENKRVTVQLIDGANIATPISYSGTNEILDGVEYDSRGQHVAYHIYNEAGNYDRVLATDPKTGLRRAVLIYGSKFRLNETRGLPMLIEDYEKIKNIERYVDATVKNAEVSSEVVFVNEHDNSSTGEDVWKTGVPQGLSGRSKEVDLKEFPTAKGVQKNMSRITKGAAINNTIGASMKMLKPNAEGTMPDFLKSNLKLVFASAGIPYEVAMSVYESNYSASRAAIKDWEHNLDVETDYFAQQFYQPFYELFLYNEVLNRNVDAYQLVQAYLKKDYITIQSINKATYTGVSVPSIDPLKEINAIRKTLGDETTPLTTYEQATEQASQLDFVEVQEQIRVEKTKISTPEINENTEDNGTN